MKKIIVLLLVAVLGLGCTACGRGNNNDTQNNPNTQSQTNNQNDSETETQSETELPLQITDANEILTKVWEQYQENERFAAVGGHYESYTDGGPAKYDITKVEDLEAVFCIPQESITMVDDVATLQHAMNVNNFSAAAYHLAEGANMQTLIDDIQNMTMNNQWLCGFPERLVMFTVGDEYLVTAYGNGEIIDTFKTKLMGIYNGAPAPVVDEDL